jgi:hypothetical protein
MNEPASLLPSSSYWISSYSAGAEALGQPVVALPLHVHRVDDVAAVVDGDEAAHLDLAGAVANLILYNAAGAAGPLRCGGEERRISQERCSASVIA